MTNRNDEPIDAATLATLASGWLRDCARQRPTLTLLGAFGVGYVLGRGMPNAMLRVGAVAAMRMLGSRALRDAMASADIDTDAVEHAAAE